MDFRTQLAVIGLGLLIWVFVGVAIRKARLYPSYALLWAALGGLLILLPLYADILRWAASHLFGIVGANHLVYGLLFGFCLIYLFYLTQKICQLTNRMERVIVSLAILERQFNDAGPAAGPKSTRATDRPLHAETVSSEKPMGGN